MSLDTDKLKSYILSILTDIEKREEDRKADFASRLSAAIETFVKSGVVTVEKGITVSVAESSGVTTSQGKGGVQ